MRHRFVHRAGTLALTLLMVALSTLMVGASGDRAKAEKASSLPEKEAVKTGVTVYSNAKASIDASNLSEGYLIVKYTGGKSVRIKVQIDLYQPAPGKGGRDVRQPRGHHRRTGPQVLRLRPH